MSTATLEQITQLVLAFRDERDWAQFHNAKDLSAGLAIEAAELQQVFLWKRVDEIPDILARKREAISDEIADVACFLLLIAQSLGVDIEAAVKSKLAKNALKYPVEQSRGRSCKYNELQDG